MKQTSNMTCWTDYPFVDLGDQPNKVAPIRHVHVLSYDGDKYATVVATFTWCGGRATDFDVQSQPTQVKAGYLYSEPGRLGQVRAVNRRKLERLVRAQ